MSSHHGLNLRFHVRNLGYVEEGDFELKPLTLLCGANNTGKTWIMYALYGFLEYSLMVAQTNDFVFDGKNIFEFSEKEDCFFIKKEDLAKIFKSILDFANLRSIENIKEWLNAKNEMLAHSFFSCITDFEKIIEAIPFDNGLGFTKSGPSDDSHRRETVEENEENTVDFIEVNGIRKTLVTHVPYEDYIPVVLIYFAFLKLCLMKGLRPFMIPAERNGLHLFFRELRNRRTSMLHNFDSNKKLVISKYQKPIADYIDWLNEIGNYTNRKRGPLHELADELKRTLTGGGYSVDSDSNINFKIEAQEQSLELHLASSTVKSLFSLWFYLEYQAQPGSMLMIDEPELNLHPDSQRRLARIIARIVNAGVRVVLSTHSDYIVREINNLLMLNRPHPQRARLLESTGIQESEILAPDKVAAYVFNDRKMTAMEITPEEGIIATTFDEVIHELNNMSDKIYYSYQDIKDDKP